MQGMHELAHIIGVRGQGGMAEVNTGCSKGGYGRSLVKRNMGLKGYAFFIFFPISRTFCAWMLFIFGAVGGRASPPQHDV